MIRWIYLLIIFAPLPFGSARPIWHWFWFLYICLFLGVLALHVFYKLYNHGQNRELSSSIRALKYYFTPSLILLACSIVAALLGRASLQHHEFSNGNMYEQHFNYWINIPVNSSAELGTVSFLMSHILALFCCVGILISNPEKVKKVTDLIGFVATAYACYGLIVYLGNFTSILWYQREHYSLALTSTFINRNNFAQYTGIGILAILTGILRSYRYAPDKNLTFWLSHHAVLRVSCLVILLISLALTLSRGGFFGTLAAMFILFYLNFKIGYWKKSTQNIFLILMTSLFLFVFLYSGESLIHRLTNIDILGVRQELWSTSIDAILSAPYSGHGLGSFASTFSFYNKELYDYHYLRAHNEYLQFMVGAGVPATVLFLLSCIVYIYRVSLSAIRERSIDAVFGVCVSLQIGIQASFDFPLQIPAISYLFIIALALSTSTISSKTNH